MDIINPWRALRNARKELQDAHLAYWDVKYNAEMLRRELAAKIAQGHFRNPKTGRIGRRGETFNG